MCFQTKQKNENLVKREITTIKIYEADVSNHSPYEGQNNVILPHYTGP